MAWFLESIWLETSNIQDRHNENYDYNVSVSNDNNINNNNDDKENDNDNYNDKILAIPLNFWPMKPKNFDRAF